MLKVGVKDLFHLISGILVMSWGQGKAYHGVNK
jgi:hypothetical protein